MIRRLVRFILTGFCLLSLLAALSVSWLWWECRRGRGYVADGSALGRYVMAESQPGGRVGLLSIRGWPGRPTLRLWTQHGYYVDHPIYWSSIATRKTSYPLGLSGADGQLTVLTRQDTGEPLRRDPVPGVLLPGSIVRRSPPMPFWSVGNIPHAAAIAAALVPPLAWTALRWRRVRERRRCVRLGLCLTCGYDLRHSPDKCPECGAASVEERTNPSAARVPSIASAG